MTVKSSMAMVTTTTVPYMYHVPQILATPKDIPYWFRYLTHYLHSDLITALQANGVERGILYLRDEESVDKLCYPLRHFEILWSDAKGPVTFFNLKMGDYIGYLGADVAVDQAAPRAVTGVDEDSWAHLIAHRQKLFQDNVIAAQNQPPLPLLSVPTRMSAPSANGAKITPWSTLRPAAFDGLLWLDPAAQPAGPAGGDGVLAWRELVSALAGVERVNRTPFFFVWPPRTLKGADVIKAKEFAKGAVRYPWGFIAENNQNYVVRVDQLTPSALSHDAPTTNPFILTMEASDPGLVPILKQDNVDGAYGYYELSFSTNPDRAGTYALLRISAKDLKIMRAGGDEEAVALPEVIIPLKLRNRVVAKFIWAGLAVLAIIAFVSADQWLPTFTIEKTSITATLIKAFLFGLATVGGKNAGIEGLFSGVGNKP